MTAGTSGFGTVLIIANPIAGQIDDMLVADLTHRCRTQVAAVELHRTSARGDARQAAAQAVRAGTDLVLAVGGDGTVREVVQGLLDSGNATDGPSLMIVPAGTGNSSYLAQWGNLDWREAVTAALTGQGARRVLLDLAQLEELDQLVLLGACSGLIAEALVAARTIGVTGRERYRIALAQAAADFISYPGKVLVDGVVVHEGMTVLANVGGGKHRGGRYQVLPRSILDDGLLDVCVIDDAMPLRMEPVDPVVSAMKNTSATRMSVPNSSSRCARAPSGRMT